MYTNFYTNPISFDHSNMAKITASSDFTIYDRFQSLELYFKCESNLKSTFWILSQDINLFNPLYYMSSYEIIQHKSIQTWLLINLSIQTSYMQATCVYPIQTSYTLPNEWDQLDIYLG